MCLVLTKTCLVLASYLKRVIRWLLKTNIVWLKILPTKNSFKQRWKEKSFPLNPLKKEVNLVISLQTKVPTNAIKEQMAFKSITRLKANKKFQRKEETNLTRKKVHPMEKGKEPSMIKEHKSLEMKNKLQKRKVMNNKCSTIVGVTLGEISFLFTSKAEHTKKKTKKVELHQIQATRVGVCNS